MRLCEEEKKTLHPVIAGFDPFKLLVDIVMNSVSFVAEMKVMSTVHDVSGTSPLSGNKGSSGRGLRSFFFSFLQFF